MECSASRTKADRPRAHTPGRGIGGADIDGPVEEEQGGVDGAALGAVAGLGVAELDMVAYVASGQGDGPGFAGHGDPITGDCGHGPGVAVVDHHAAVGAQGALVVAGHDHITNM